MDELIAKLADRIAGRLSGFDRLVFRGTLRKIAYPFGMQGYLWANQVPMSRKSRLICAHHLIRKVPHPHRYHLTADGAQLVAAQIAANALNNMLIPKAA